MSLVSDFKSNKEHCYKMARENPASEKFYLTQEGVWDTAYHTAKEEAEALIEILEEWKMVKSMYGDEVTEAYDKAIDLIERRLLGGIE